MIFFDEIVLHRYVHLCIHFFKYYFHIYIIVLNFPVKGFQIYFQIIFLIIKCAYLPTNLQHKILCCFIIYLHNMKKYLSIRSLFINLHSFNFRFGSLHFANDCTTFGIFHPSGDVMLCTQISCNFCEATSCAKHKKTHQFYTNRFCILRLLLFQSAAACWRRTTFCLLSQELHASSSH